MKVVITGGSCAGKTSVVNAFAEMGHSTVPESGQLVTQELIERLGIPGMNRFRQHNPLEFLDMVAERQAKLESAVAYSGRPLFFDRSMHDYVAYCRVINVNPSQRILDMLKTRYDYVFLLETLPDFNPRPETGRTLDREFSLQWRDSARQVFQEHDMEPIHVKAMPLEKRLEFIKGHINLK